MLNGNPSVLAWLNHRAGSQRLEKTPFAYREFALEQNDRWPGLAARFGDREFEGFVGFVDLVSFSTATMGMAPAAIAEFLRPFLEGTLAAVESHFGLVDKTIGDEVMFVLPDLVHDRGGSTAVSAGAFLASVRGLQARLGERYRMRIGVAYGRLAVLPAAGRGYVEHTVVGEAVALAKRLHTLEPLRDPSSIACAFAMLDREADGLPGLEVLTLDLANIGWKAETVEPSTLAALKGVSPSHGVVLLPATQLPEWARGL